jgi:hypothetical protein
MAKFPKSIYLVAAYQVLEMKSLACNHQLFKYTAGTTSGAGTAYLII